MSFDPSSDPFEDQLKRHLEFVYPDKDLDSLCQSIIEVFEDFESPAKKELWTEQDSLLITYGDTLKAENEEPLETLNRFLSEKIGNSISAVHVLPFCPFSSDDGFAVIDYLEVNPDLGDWDQLTEISKKYRLMADIVINHVSSKSDWFKDYQAGKSPERDYFIEVDPQTDLSQVVRPRASPLLREVETEDGTKHVWCTFSHDQVDLNFENPAVLLEFLEIVKVYLDKGVRFFRLDAIGYLWKKIGTTCIHLPETHEVVRLIRLVLDNYAPGSLVITETNVPNAENLTYFGNCNEAHMIYNFSLAPLVVHSLLTGHAQHLKRWMMSMPPAPVDCTYLNFTASHDGLGMRPAEGLLSEAEQQEMVKTIERFGGLVSRRSMPDGSERIYELNISLFDALKGTVEGEDEHQIARFLCSQTMTMGLEGIPAFYIHSLLATPNDTAGVARTGRLRSINRHQWNYEELLEKLDDPNSPQSQVCTEMLRRLKIRSKQPAFHPHATQFTLHLKDHFFGFWRQSRDRQQSLFAIYNLSTKKRKFDFHEINLISNEHWVELISGQYLSDLNGSMTLRPYQCIWITNRPLEEDVTPSTR